MEYDLRKALAAGEFELHYQPVVHLETNKISGFEALIRWRHPEKGMICAWHLHPARRGDRLHRAPRRMGHQAGLRYGREVAGAHPHLGQPLARAVQESGAGAGRDGRAGRLPGLAPDRLELEITESALLDDSDATLAMLYRLRELGVRIAMDDFGTGYSSLAYLQSFPFDRIKIDRSFIKDIADGVGSLNIVRAMAALAKGLGMETTAEGVETNEQLDTVKSEGCTEMQGFLFSRPRPADELEELLLPGRQSGTSRPREQRASSQH